MQDQEFESEALVELPSDIATRPQFSANLAPHRKHDRGDPRRAGGLSGERRAYGINL